MVDTVIVNPAVSDSGESSTSAVSWPAILVPTFLFGVEGADVADGPPEGVDCPGADAPEMSLELGEGHLDRIEVGTVGRQEEEPRAALSRSSLSSP